MSFEYLLFNVFSTYNTWAINLLIECKPWVSNLFCNMIHSSTDVFAIHRFQTAPIVFVSTLCSLDGKYDPVTVECALLGEISETVSSSEGICCGWGEASEPVHSVCPWRAATGTSSASADLTDSSKVCLSCTLWYLCVPVADPQTSAALLPGVSLQG